MKRLLMAVLALALILPAPALLAAETKIGFVDLQKALNTSVSGKRAKEQIGKKLKEYEGTITSRQEELKKLKEELEKQAVLLSEEARGEKERDYQKKLKDFQRFTKDVQEELQQKDADYTRQIIEEIFGVIKEMGQKEGYTLILEKSESSLLFADEKIDLTEAVIKAYDAKSKKGGK